MSGSAGRRTTFPTGRICVADDCATILSTFNPTDRCSVHERAPARSGRAKAPPAVEAPERASQWYAARCADAGCAGSVMFVIRRTAPDAAPGPRAVALCSSCGCQNILGADGGRTIDYSG